jgi:hypothetical protein
MINKKNKEKYNSVKKLYNLCIEDNIFLDIKFIDGANNNVSSKYFINIIIKENDKYGALKLNNNKISVEDLSNLDLENKSHTLNIYNWYGYNFTLFLFNSSVESHVDNFDNFDEYYEILEYLYNKYEIYFAYKSEYDKEWIF